MNRKKQSVFVRFGPAIKVVVFCLFTCGLGLGYVWQKHQITHLGRQIKKSEEQLTKIRHENKLDSHALSQLRSPQLLYQRASQLQLGLSMPRPEQIVVLLDHKPEANPTRMAAQRQIKAQQKSSSAKRH